MKFGAQLEMMKPVMVLAFMTLFNVANGQDQEMPPLEDGSEKTTITFSPEMLGEFQVNGTPVTLDDGVVGLRIQDGSTSKILIENHENHELSYVVTTDLSGEPGVRDDAAGQAVLAEDGKGMTKYVFGEAGVTEDFYNIFNGKESGVNAALFEVDQETGVFTRTNIVDGEATVQEVPDMFVQRLKGAGDNLLEQSFAK